MNLTILQTISMILAGSGLDPLAAKQRTGSFLEHSTPWMPRTFALSRSQQAATVDSIRQHSTTSSLSEERLG